MKLITAIVFAFAIAFSSPPATAAARTIVSTTALDSEWSLTCVQVAVANDGTVWCAHFTTYSGHEWMSPSGTELMSAGLDIAWVQLDSLPSGRSALGVVGSMYSGAMGLPVLATAWADDGTAWNLIPDDLCYYCSHATSTLHWYLALPALPPSE